MTLCALLEAGFGQLAADPGREIVLGSQGASGDPWVTFSPLIRHISKVQYLMALHER